MQRGVDSGERLGQEEDTPGAIRVDRGANAVRLVVVARRDGEVGAWLVVPVPIGEEVKRHRRRQLRRRTVPDEALAADGPAALRAKPDPLDSLGCGAAETPAATEALMAGLEGGVHLLDEERAKRGVGRDVRGREPSGCEEANAEQEPRAQREPRSSVSRFEHVPGLPHRADERRADRVELLPEITHVRLDDVRVAGEVVVPARSGGSAPSTGHAAD